MTEIDMPTLPSPARGRFAPSPTGPLHFGSLVAAVGSYLNVKSKAGQWLVRIEDIDVPRVVKGSASAILSTLEQYGLHWDAVPAYQSAHLEIYQEALEKLHQAGLTYVCTCSRREIRARGGIYQGVCAKKQHPKTAQTATRLHNQQPTLTFTDALMGHVQGPEALAHEDFIVQRSDGQFAYNFVSVVDDINAGITEVVRGRDLLEPTARHITLYKTLKKPLPLWLHLPLALNNAGDKLSKFTHASAVASTHPELTLYAVLDFLGHKPPPKMYGANCCELLQYALTTWDIKKIPTDDRVYAA